MLLQNLTKFMFNKLYTLLSENIYLFTKQFEIQAKYSTEQAVSELVAETSNSYSECSHTPGVFITCQKNQNIIRCPLILIKQTLNCFIDDET